MVETLQVRGGSREDRLWESALAELTAEGVMGREQVEVVLERHHRIEEVARQSTRRMALIELAGYLGAAMTIGGVVAISSQVWRDFSEFVQVLLLAGLAAVVLLAAALVAAGTPGGAQMLSDPPQATRRRVVGVLGVVGAGLTMGAMALAYDQALPAAQVERWMWTGALAALIIAALVSRFAPGVIPTLAVGGFLGASVLLGMLALGWTRPDWAVPLAVMLLAALASLVLVRWLTPAVLVEAVAVVAWLVVSVPLLSTEPGWGLTDDEAAAMLWIGRVGLLSLIAIGAVRFARGGEWPWAAGVAIGSAAFVGFTFADALGGAIGMTLAGVVLIAIAVLMLRAHRRAEHPAAR